MSFDEKDLDAFRILPTRRFHVGEEVSIDLLNRLDRGLVIAAVETWPERPDLTEWIYSIRCEDGKVWHTLRPVADDELCLFTDH